MPYNVDLMLQVRNTIKMNPEQHNQATYECGTARCIAGWAIVLNTSQSVEHTWDRMTSAFDEGMEALGLTFTEAATLFYEMDNKTALAKLDALIEKGKNQ